MRKRRITTCTLNKKIAKWKIVLQLEDWKITGEFVSARSNLMGPSEWAHIHFDRDSKEAIMRVYNCYYNSVFYNIDTLILHELTHLLLDPQIIDYKSLRSKIPGDLVEHPKFKELEEYTCDTFAEIIYKISTKKRKSR